MGESGIKSVGVIGIGTMGNGIAQVCAQQGLATVVLDVSADAAEAAKSSDGDRARKAAGEIKKACDACHGEYR